MKTLYLHIGMPRTATTVLQKFCADNQEELNRQGYCYPVMPFRYRNTGQLRTAHFMFGRVTDENGNRDMEKEQQYFKDGFQTLYHTFQTYDNVILSDEGLWNCGFREKDNVWEKLKREMDANHFATKVIVYLRRQDDFLFSWWSQRIKEGLYQECVLSWEEMTEKLPIVHLDYCEMLNNISGYVGKENLIVRRFDRQYFIGGHIYEDFINIIGLKFSDVFKVQETVLNKSLTKNNAEIKRILNKLPDLDADSNWAFQNILAHNSNSKKDNEKYSMFSEPEALALFEKYREGNRLIAEKYMGMEGDLFPFEYTAEEKWSPENGEMLEDIILFMGTSYLRMERKMEKELQEQKREIENLRNTMKHPVRWVLKKIKSKFR
ncbi:MAG: hypothetical protein K2L07_06235 [Lachnospiraceae bacterium]|nr:hypothetical protein [Lachnospiraceae bacterium]